MNDDIFETIEITDWSKVFELPEVKDSTSVFRGQSDASWPLKTSLQREFERLAISKDHYLQKEYALVRSFQRRAHLYTHDLPAADDVVGWLALMQHHGAPTRLLDFTYSFYVACYFAFSDSYGESAVWMVDDLWLRTCLNAHGLRDDSLGAVYAVANEMLSSDHGRFKGGGKPDQHLDCVLMIEPTHQTQRLAVQQGLFLMPYNLQADFTTNLANIASTENKISSDFTSDVKRHFKKIVFTKEAGRVAVRELQKMNVTSESLFPGIDGFARSLRHTVLAI